MNKNEAKKLSVNDVVVAKNDGTKHVVAKINEYEEGKFRITGYNAETNKFVKFEHAELKTTEEKGEFPAMSKVGRKTKAPEYETFTGEEFTQEMYDKAGMNSKRNVNIDGVVVYKDENSDDYISAKVGSNEYYRIKANNLNNAKKSRNTIG